MTESEKEMLKVVKAILTTSETQLFNHLGTTFRWLMATFCGKRWLNPRTGAKGGPAFQFQQGGYGLVRGGNASEHLNGCS